MTYKFTKTTLIFLPVTLLMMTSGFERDGDKSFFAVLEEKLEHYNRQFFNERAYVVTDRFVYRPAEDVWFKGYVSSPVIPHDDTVSVDFYIKLLNSKGEEVVSRRYPLYENQVSGRFLIPRTSIPGKYYLIAYTGWMKNQIPREAFIKEILIGKYFDKRLWVDILYDRLFYYPDDSLQASIRLIDPSGKPVPQAEFDYSLGSFAKSLIRGSGKTDNNGIYRLKCKIPQADDIFLLTIEVTNRRISGEYSMVIPAATTVPEISFRSEDGNVVQGIENMMTFSCRNRYGLPVSIEGEIINTRGKILQDVKANNWGMGSFTYLPPDDSCFLRIKKPGGIVTKYPLPLARKSGMVVHLLKSDADTAHFAVRSAGYNPDTIQYWVAVANRQIVWKKKVRLNGKAEVKIPISDLQHGFMQVSVFNSRQRLVAERQFYIPVRNIRLRIKTDRQIYQNRQRVALSMEYLGKSSKADVAIAVSLRQLTLSPLDLNFEETLSAFPYDSMSRWPGLTAQPSDISLIMSGYRQVDWQRILSESPEMKVYKRQDGLSGTVTDKKDNVTQHAKVRVTHIPNFRFYETQTNGEGNFRVMFGSDIIDFNYLNVEAYDARGKINLEASVNQEYSMELRNNIIQKEENRDHQKVINILSYDDPDVIYSLRYGPRKYKKTENEARRRYDPKQYTDYANVMDIIQEIKPFQIRNNMIVFSDSVSAQYEQEGAIIVINGALKGNHINILASLLPSDITNINISTSLTDIHRYTPINFHGVIEITTIQGMYRYRQPGVQLGMDVLNTSREFYSPNYSIESPTTSDNRKTLFWNSGLSIPQGQTTLITFYTSDIKGIYYGKVEGMDSDGKPVFGDFTIMVE